METDKRISRREALTRMGMIVAGAAASSIGLPALTSCTEKPQKKRIILYFTATGNCLHVARQLAESEEQLLSIPQMVKQNQYEFEADEIGLVYPIYGHMPPNMVRNFIKKAKLKAAYKFAVLTYGARKCDSVEIWNDISSKAGNKFDYINTLVMVDNWLPNFDMNEQIKIDKHIPENLRQITEDLSQRRHWHEPVSEEERQMHAGFMARSGLDPESVFSKRAKTILLLRRIALIVELVRMSVRVAIMSLLQTVLKCRGIVISVLPVFRTVRRKPFSLRKMTRTLCWQMVNEIRTPAIGMNISHWWI